MSKDNIVKVYAGNYLSGLGHVTIIITVNTTDRRNLYFEYFAFLEGADILYDEYAESCDASAVPIHIAAIEAGNMIENALFQSRQRLSQKLHAKYIKNISRFHVKNIIDFELSDNRAIVRLIMRNRFADKIDHVMRVTKSASLRAALMKYYGLPKLQHQPLKTSEE